LVLGCAGRVGIFGSTFPSIIERNGKQYPEKMSSMAGDRYAVFQLSRFAAFQLSYWVLVD